VEKVAWAQGEKVPMLKEAKLELVLALKINHENCKFLWKKVNYKIIF
jgi:hypothetical protein